MFCQENKYRARLISFKELAQLVALADRAEDSNLYLYAMANLVTIRLSLTKS